MSICDYRCIYVSFMLYLCKYAHNNACLCMRDEINVGVNALFIPTFRGRFYSSPYISILSILVPNPINACYFSHFHQLIDENGCRD